ncbi:MAG: hypothetical protein PF795_14225 [Kiritimatiellae bacterium]|jgi:hypothetical protein|nr:hypothetical protein [Kiritimatiellia bacterium]
MDTDNLSEEAYDVIRAAARECDTLKAELGAMALHCRMEDDWLRGVREHLQDILEDAEEYVDGWNLEEEEGCSPATMGLLAADLMRQVDQILSMPLKQRTPRPE